MRRTPRSATFHSRRRRTLPAETATATATPLPTTVAALADGWRRGLRRETDAFRALVARAREARPPQSLADAAHAVMAAAVLLAEAYALEPRHVRIGRRWEKDAVGKRAQMRPRDLPPEKYARWLRAEAYKAAEADLLHLPYPARPEVDGDAGGSADLDAAAAVSGMLGHQQASAWHVESGEADSLFLDLLDGTTPDAVSQARLQALAERCSASEVEFMEAWLRRPDASLADVDRAMKWAPGTSRTRLARIRARN